MKGIIKLGLKVAGLQSIRRDYSRYNLYTEYKDNLADSNAFINIGAGSFKHAKWTNIDFASDHYRKLQNDFINYDLMTLTELPLPDCSVNLAYTSHTIEHVTDNAVQNLFNQVYRVLKSGGGFRVTAPCASLAFDAFMRNDIEFFYWKDWRENNTKSFSLSDWSIEDLVLHHFATELLEDSAFINSGALERLKDMSRVEEIESITSLCSFNPDKPGNHINWWNYDKAKHMLLLAGFSKVYISGYGQSKFAPMRDIGFFDSTHPSSSFYLEAIK